MKEKIKKKKKFSKLGIDGNFFNKGYLPKKCTADITDDGEILNFSSWD